VCGEIEQCCLIGKIPKRSRRRGHTEDRSDKIQKSPPLRTGGLFLWSAGCKQMVDGAMNTHIQITKIERDHNSGIKIDIGDFSQCR